jgi:hypothetical protein
MKRLLFLAVILPLLTLPLTAFAQAPDRSPRPVLRPIAIETRFTKTAAPFVVLRPKLRPDARGQSHATAAVQKVVLEQTITEDITARTLAKTLNNTNLAEDAESKFTPVKSKPISPIAALAQIFNPSGKNKVLRPKARPKNLKVTLLEPKVSSPGKPVKYSKNGSVCGVAGIRGYKVAPVRSKGGGCGISAPVKITEVDGVALTREALVGCDAAKALYGWVQKKAKPTVGRKGGGLAKIDLIAGYSCRTRNSQKGAKLSEHAKGNAVDIAGFVLKDGTKVTVLNGWRSSAQGPLLKSLHKSACGPFGTVLGPSSDRHHQDHLHFDVAKHRGGAYCR